MTLEPAKGHEINTTTRIMTIKKDEIKIEGKWHFDGSKMVADEQSQRIEWLTKNHLAKIATDFSGWFTLYKDPSDGRYWELSYPNGEMQGGGAPSLTFLSESEAGAKYIV